MVAEKLIVTSRHIYIVLMKDLIKKSFLEESEVLLKSEMVTLTGGDNLSDKTADHPVVFFLKINAPNCNFHLIL